MCLYMRRYEAYTVVSYSYRASHLSQPFYVSGSIKFVENIFVLRCLQMHYLLMEMVKQDLCWKNRLGRYGLPLICEGVVFIQRVANRIKKCQQDTHRI